MFTHKNKLIFIGTLLLLIVGQYTGLGVVEKAYAITPSLEETLVNGFIPTAAYILGFLMHFMYLALSVLDNLLDTRFYEHILYATGGGDALLDIWQLSRDIVNVCFAFILVFVSLYTVITANTEMVKTQAGKFILAVILVNFSWFGPRVVLDVANVLTATIYSIPSLMSVSHPCRTYEISDTPTDCKYIKQVIVFSKDKLGETAVAACDEAIKDPNNTASSNPNIISLTESICVELADLPATANTPTGIMHGFLVNHARILYLPVITAHTSTAATGAGAPDKSGDIMRFTTQLLMSFMMTVAVAIPIIAMAVIFAVRILVLWITTAFMPFAFIGVIMGDKMGEFSPVKIWELFVKQAFLPAVTALPFCVGFIMLNAAANVTCPPNPRFPHLCEKHGDWVVGVDTLWKFLWMFLGIMVMYQGFFFALNFEKEIAGKIGGFFKGVGDFINKAPLALPIIPLPDGSKGSILSASSTVKNLPSIAMRDNILDKKDFGRILNSLSGNQKANLTSDSAEIRQIATTNRFNINDTIRTTINNTSTLNAKDLAEQLRKALNDAGVEFNKQNLSQYMKEIKIDDRKMKDVLSKLGDNNFDS